jgi:hypothetical protein
VGSCHSVGESGDAVGYPAPLVNHQEAAPQAIAPERPAGVGNGPPLRFDHTAAVTFDASECVLSRVVEAVQDARTGVQLEWLIRA